MKRKLKNKLSLTKTTISDLDRVTGGKMILCGCDYILNNAACNHDRVQSVNRSACLSCYEDVFTSCG